MWYQAFILALVGLRIWATDKDRNALNVVLAASLVSTFLVHLVTQEITGAWKLVVPATLEVMTIAALLRWSRNRTGYLNVGLLCVAWFTHVLCFVDVWSGSNLVYDNYETILALVAVGQLLTCYDTALSALIGVRAWLFDAGANRVRGVHAASDASGSLRHSSGHNL